MKMTVVIALLAAALTAAYAEDVSVKVYVNAQLQSYNPSARLRNGTVYVPLRQGAESLGAQCKWQAQTGVAQICSDSGCHQPVSASPSTNHSPAAVAASRRGCPAQLVR